MFKVIKNAAYIGAALAVIVVASGFSSNDTGNIGLELNTSVDNVYDESAAGVPSSEADENDGAENPEQDNIMIIKPFFIFGHQV